MIHASCPLFTCPQPWASAFRVRVAMAELAWRTRLPLAAAPTVTSANTVKVKWKAPCLHVDRLRKIVCTPKLGFQLIIKWLLSGSNRLRVEYENNELFLFAVDVCRPNPCLYGGVCEPIPETDGNLDKWAFRCACPKFYRGKRCERKDPVPSPLVQFTRPNPRSLHIQDGG